MSTAAQRHGWWKAKGRDYGYFMREPWVNGFPYSYHPTAQEHAEWARSHGYPEWPNTHPAYAHTTDVDRMAFRAFAAFHDHLRRAKAARMFGDPAAAAYHANEAASCRGTYAFNRRLTAQGVERVDYYHYSDPDNY
jgi:hypothetical protein